MGQFRRISKSFCVTMWCLCFRVVVQIGRLRLGYPQRVYLHHLQQQPRIPCASSTPYLCIYRRLNLNNSMNHLSRALMGETKGDIRHREMQKGPNFKVP